MNGVAQQLGCDVVGFWGVPVQSVRENDTLTAAGYFDVDAMRCDATVGERLFNIDRRISRVMKLGMALAKRPYHTSPSPGFTTLLPYSIATRWMVLALRNAAHWPAYRVRVAMAPPASRLNQTSWTTTATRQRNGNANALPAIWGQPVRYLSARTIPVNTVALVFNFRAAATSVSVRWASTGITASTVSRSFLHALSFTQ